MTAFPTKPLFDALKAASCQRVWSAAASSSSACGLPLEAGPGDAARQERSLAYQEQSSDRQDEEDRGGHELVVRGIVGVLVRVQPYALAGVALAR